MRRGTGAAVGEVQEQEPGRSRTKGHAAAAATPEREGDIYLPLPAAIKHFINESFQLLARDFTLYTGTEPNILYCILNGKNQLMFMHRESQ